MTQADKIEAAQGQVLHEQAFRAFSEAFDGQGILAAGDLEVSADGDTAMGFLVEPGEAWYDGARSELENEYDDTLSDGDADDDRWDTIAWDTDQEEVVVHEGDPGSTPAPPDLEGDEFLLAFILIEAEATDFDDSRVFNWRVHHQAADNTHVRDPDDRYSSETLAGVLDELIRQQGDDPLEGPLDLTDFSGGAPFELGEDPGEFGSIVDLSTSSDASEGDEVSYGFAIDGGLVLKIYGEADGDGGVQNLRVDLNGRPLYDGSTELYDPGEEEFVQDRLAGPAADLSGYPLPLDDLDSPYPLSEITDRDLDGNDLKDDDGPGTLYDAETEEFGRDVLDDELRSHVLDSNSYTSDDEEVIFVDTDSIGESVTITLASDDAEEGHQVVIVDVGGEASSNTITVDTEGDETINGGDEENIRTAYTGRSFVCDGNDWFTPSPAPLSPERQIEGTESGEVVDGEQGTLIFDHLEDGETLEITKAVFMLDSGEAVPTDLNLIIATLDNSGSYNERETIFSGDGSKVWDGDEDSRGSPLASWTNDTGSGVTVAVLADNDTGGDESIMAKVTGERV